MQHAKIFNSPEKCMRGVELKRLRKAIGFTQPKLVEKLNNWGWTIKKVQRFEQVDYFCLCSSEMQSLLFALNATSI